MVKRKKGKSKMDEKNSYALATVDRHLVPLGLGRAVELHRVEVASAHHGADKALGAFAVVDANQRAGNGDKLLLAADLGEPRQLLLVKAVHGLQQGFFRRPLNDRDLREIASVTGGKFFHATDARSLLEIYEEIDRLERTRSEERRFVRYDELSLNWLLVAFGAIALQILLDSTRLRKFP